LEDGSLSDVAPTCLEILGLPKPAEMTGRSLLAVGSNSAPAGIARESRVTG
jgi:arylsulfatase A-like enzyme